MATTRNTRTSRPGKDLDLRGRPSGDSHQTDADSDTGSKVKEFIKRVALPLFLVLVGIVTWIVLWATAMTSGPFGKLSYPDKVATIITIDLLVSLVPAIILVITRRGQRYSYTMIRVIAMVVSVLFCIVFLAALIRLAGNTGFAQSLMGLAGVPGILALVFLGGFAYVLARYKDDDGSLDADKQELADIDDKLKAANDENKAAERELTVRRERHAQAETNVQKLEDDAVKLSTDLEEARKAHNQSKLVEQLKDAEESRSKDQSEFNALPAEIDDIEKKLKSEKDAEHRQYLSDKLATKQARRKELERLLDPENPNGISRKADDLKKQVDASPEAKNLEAATKAHKANSEELDKARERERELNKRLREGHDIVAEKAAHVEAHKTRRTELNDSLGTAKSDEKSVWRDVVFPLVVLFVLAMAFVPTWQGYIMTQFR